MTLEKESDNNDKVQQYGQQFLEVGKVGRDTCWEDEVCGSTR